MHGHMNVKKVSELSTFWYSFFLHKAQHVSGDTPSIIRSLKLHKQPLDLHTWKVVGRCQVPDNVQQLHVRKPSTVLRKIKGCLCSLVS